MSRTAIVRSAIADLADFDPQQSLRGELAPRVIDLYERVRVLAKQVDAFKAAIKAEVETNGPIVGDGTQICLGTRRQQTIDAQIAWPILAETLNEDELAGCVKLSKPKMLEAVAGHSAKGQKGKDKDAILEKLEEAGAISVAVTHPLQVKKTDKE